MRSVTKPRPSEAAGFMGMRETIWLLDVQTLAQP